MMLNSLRIANAYEGSTDNIGSESESYVGLLDVLDEDV